MRGTIRKISAVRTADHALGIKGAKKEGRSWLLPETAGIPLHSRSEKRPKLLPLPVGISGYVEAVTKYYYIDIGIAFRGKEVVVKQADK